jgi:hypothetical protein
MIQHAPTADVPTIATADHLRPVATAIGLASVAIGAAPILAPGLCARAFGFPTPTPAVASVMRSLGARDLVLGMGLWSAATHGGKYAPWLLARTLSDAGDVLSIGLAAGAGLRNPRVLALGALALGATATEAVLFRAAKHGA